MFNNIYRDKKVIVTGNTGFKGSWLSLWLHGLGAKVTGISKDIPTTPSLFKELGLQTKTDHHFADIRDGGAMTEIFTRVQPDFVFHLAAQPIVSVSYDNPVDTFQTNTIGTANVLEALRSLTHACNAVIITSDKCYDNVEWIWGYREQDALGGKDPYSASKAAAEMVIKTYFYSYFNKPDSKVRLTTVRAGNVIGGGDWALNRIVPDCFRSWNERQPVRIRNPYSTRPWQHVLEPLSGYLRAGQVLAGQEGGINGEPFNIGPSADQNHTVLELLEAVKGFWKSDALKEPVEISAGNGFHEAGLLKLNCDKALYYLQWKPALDFAATARFTGEWYNHYYNNGKKDISGYTVNQIQEYAEAAEEKINRMGTIDAVTITPVRIIRGESGDVMHALKQQEPSFSGFGEAYFSTVNNQAVKGWKKHRRMILNLVVPCGAIRFVLFDDRPGSKTFHAIQELVLSPENYQRLTVPPGVWMAFQGLSEGLNLLLNIASIPHDPEEAENLPVENDLIPFSRFT